MKKELFSRYLMSLPDTAFFDLYRSYLGPIQTPFKKQNLIQDLIQLLKDCEVQQRIRALLNEDDRRWLSIIGLSGSLPPTQLTALFCEDYSEVDIHQRVLNLEDRLLIIIDPSSNELCLNPLLEDMLLQHAVGLSYILPDLGPTETGIPQCRTTPATLFTILAFFRLPRSLYRQSGGLRKKEQDRLLAIFPSFTGSGVLGSAIESLLQSLRDLGLIHQYNNGDTVADSAAWKAFFQLPHTHRISYLTGAMIASTSQSINEAAACTLGLLQLLIPGHSYNKHDVRDAINCIHAAAGRRHSPWTEDITRALITIGVFIPGANNTIVAADCTAPQTESDQQNTSRLLIQPSFEVTITDLGPLPDLLPLADVLEPIRCDIYPQFELTRDRCIHAMVHNQRALELLHSLSQSELPQNIDMSIELWKSESQSLTMFSGTVLVADDERRHIIEHHQMLAPLIDQVLAPGVFLMKCSQDMVQKVFQEAGLGHVPTQSVRRQQKKSVDEVTRNPVRMLQQLPLGPFNPPSRDNTSEKLSSHPDGSQPPQDFTDIITQQISDDYHRELLLNRSRQKLLLMPEQVNPDYLPNERTEARGLDYLGKVRLLERILQSSSDLAEVTERDRSGKPMRRLLRPTKISPSGNDLYLTGLLIPGGDPVRLAVRKLSLVRKVRSGFNSRLF